MFHRYFETSYKDVSVMSLHFDLDAPLDDTIMLSNDSSKIDFGVHVSPLPLTFDIPSDFILLVPTILGPSTSDQGRKYPFRARKQL